MTDCIVNQDILNNCLSYDYGGIDRIFLLPFDEFQVMEKRPKYAAFSSAFNNSFKIGKGGFYSSILSTSKFIEVQTDDTSTFKNVFQSHSYQQTLTTKIKRIDEELDIMLSKNKNKKFVVVVFPNINNKIWETFYNKQSLSSNFCFFMGVENGCSWQIQYDVEQVGGGSYYTIQFTANSYESLPVVEDVNPDSLIEDNEIDFKFIPKEFICVGKTNYEVAMYAVCVTNDRNQQPIDKNGELCSKSGLKQAICTYRDVNTYKEYLIGNLNDYDIIDTYDLDAVFEGRKVKRYNTICYNFYNLILQFKDYPDDNTLDELYDFYGETKSYKIECIGKSAKYTVSSNVNWITTNIAADNTLTLTVAENDGDSRTGKITLTHKDDSSLKLYININQSKNIIIIPEFDYLVFRYFWGENDGRDLDTSTGYVNTGIILPNGKKLDEMPVGYGMAGRNDNETSNYVQFGGDNMASGNECVFITTNTLITHYDTLPDIVNIDVYANWWGSRLTGNCEFELTAYKGGIIVKEGSFNYNNVGGTAVLITRTKVNIASQGSGNTSDYKNRYSKIGQIQYNKLRRNATYVIDAPVV